LNLAEIRVVENHLSAKYGIALASAADFYTGDDPAKGDYDLDVFGVGRVNATNKLLEAGSAGFGFQAVDATLGDGEFLMAGHKKATNAWVSTDLPAGSGIRLRWDRVWYVDTTGTMDALFAFGFTDGGLSPQTLQPAEYYALLYSPTNAFQFSVLAAGGWNGPDQILFTLSGSQIQDGYYTLGIAVPEPASLVLLVLGAAGLLLVRRR
ncbi:MAG: PEP-CTERM sorting domain-containing protein, partial [Thermoguttaceae bacterium]|nr:PEP-CTERM sorting domain-containing protein [Thermoguttaceae bacterium]